MPMKNPAAGIVVEKKCRRFLYTHVNFADIEKRNFLRAQNVKAEMEDAGAG